MVLAVLVIQRVALSFQILAVEPVVETSSIITLRVTLSVVEVPPALQRGRAVLPWVVKVERAVAIVPAACMVVTEFITVLVVLELLAQRDEAGDLHLRRRWDVFTKSSGEAVIQDVAAEAGEVCGAEALVVWCLGGISAGATVITGVGAAGAVGGILTLRPRE